jgi:metal-responsive CopG/Arc/MetJ family transcriptional regulator
MPRQKSDIKSARVLISLPDEFLTEIDELAGTEHRSRSDLIREALRAYMRTMDNAKLSGDALID